MNDVTLTLMGEEVPALLAAIDFFPKKSACFTLDEKCDGVDVAEPDQLNQQCLVCAELTNIALILGNIEQEITRRWTANPQ